MTVQDLPQIILGSVALAALLYFLTFTFSILGAIYQ